MLAVPYGSLYERHDVPLFHGRFARAIGAVAKLAARASSSGEQR